MRQCLVDELRHSTATRACDFITRQKGMFSYTSPTAAQAARLRDEFGDYLLSSGRLCVAGFN
jgi:aromatic-amino-acid transaminase